MSIGFGFKYNGIHTGKFSELAVQSISNPLLPDRKLIRTSIPGRAGELVFQGEPKNKTLVFKCVLFGRDMPSRRRTARNIASWLASETDRQLILDYEKDKHYNVVRTVSNVDLSFNQSVDEFDLEFECEPYQYGKLHEVNGINNLKLTNNGTAEADTIITLSGSGDVSVECKEQRFTLINMHGTVILDSKHMLIYSYDKQNRTAWHNGGFIKLPFGESVLTVSGDVTDISARFYETWL